METISIRTTGMHCPSCAMNIDLTVGDLPGVDEVSTSLADGLSTVTFDPSSIDADTIAEAIREAGYGAELVS